jgi:hypothetical protein
MKAFQSRDPKGAGASPHEKRPLADARGSKVRVAGCEQLSHVGISFLNPVHVVRTAEFHACVSLSDLCSMRLCHPLQMRRVGARSDDRLENWPQGTA